jgi:hypothetical protein
MNIKTTIILLILLIGIGGYFVFVERGRSGGTGGTEEETAEKPLFTADDVYPEGAKTFAITWADGTTATMERDKDGKWNQTAPVRFPMHPIRLQGVVNEACFLRFVDKFIPDQDGKPSLADTALDKPRATVRITGQTRDVQINPKTGEPDVKTAPFDQTIYVGGTLTGSRGYVRLGKDSHVYVVNHELHRLLVREKASDWRAAKFEAPNDAQADLISLISDGQPIELVKVKGEWQFGQPLSGRVSPKVPGAILELLRRSEVGRFVEDNPKNLAVYGLDHPTAAITVHTTAIEPNVRTLRIGNAADPDGNHYHASWSLGSEPSRVVFTVTRDTRARFMAPKADDLRDPRITPFRTSGLAEATIRLADQPAVRLQRTPSGWAFAPGADQAAPAFKPDQDAVGQLFDAVTTAGARFYHPHTTQGDKPLAVVEITSKIPGGTDTLVFFTPPAAARQAGDETPLVMVVRNNETTGYLVPEEKLKPLFAPPVMLRDRQLVELKPESIERIVVKRSDGITYDFKQFVTPIDGKVQWQLAGHDTFERELLELLVRQMSSLRAESWVAREVKPGDSTVEVTVEAKGRAPMVLTLDLITRQGRLAKVDGVFLLEEKQKMLLDAEYRPRTVLPLAPGDIAQVSITKGNAAPFAFVKDDLNRYMALDATGKPQPYPEIDARKAAALFDSLTPLRAWRLVTKPETIQAKDALNTIELATRTGQRHTIRVGFPDQPALAVIKDVWFTLQPEALARLLAETVKKGEPKKDK